MSENLDLIFSPSACSYIKKMLEKQSGIGFRLSVKKTGCSGFSYLPEVVSSVTAGDLLLEIQGLQVYVDPKWIALFNGLQIDYVEEEKSGLKQKRLIFTNPNEGNRCGCGESFHLE